MQIRNARGSEMPIQNGELTVLFFDTENLDVNNNPYLSFVNKDGIFVIAGTGGATTLASLTDVQLSSPVAGQGLVYDGTKWNNENIAQPLVYYSEDTGTKTAQLFVNDAAAEVNILSGNNLTLDSATKTDIASSGDVQIGAGNDTTITATNKLTLSSNSMLFELGTNSLSVDLSANPGDGHLDLIAKGRYYAECGAFFQISAGSYINLTATDNFDLYSKDFKLRSSSGLNEHYIEATEVGGITILTGFSKSIILDSSNDITIDADNDINLDCNANLNINSSNLIQNVAASITLNSDSLAITNNSFGIFGTPPIAKQSISLGTGTLTDLINALGSYGLINVTA